MSGGHVARRWPRVDRFLFVIAGGTILSRLALAWAGVPLNLSAVGPKGADHYWQLLDPSWLRHDLVPSVWSLTMQPPLYNLAVGAWLHLPVGWQAPVAALSLTACFLAIALASYATMVLLGVHRVVALVATLVLVVANPGQALFTTVPFYAEPTAALVTLTAWLAVRCVRRPTVGSSAAFAALAATAALVNTSVQPIVVLGLVAVLLVACRGAWRPIALGALVPCLVLVGWSGLQWSRVGTPATSTWLGMNLTHVTFNHAPHRQLHQLIADGKISRIALLSPFAPLSAYGVAPVRVGPPASASARRPDGTANFNNRAYAEVSRRYLHDELAFVAADPGHVATMVSRGLRLWTIPEDQYFLFFGVTQVQPWENAYDNIVMLQGIRNPFNPLAELANEAAPVHQLSVTLMVATALCVLGTPTVIVSCRRRRRSLAVAMALPWLLFTQAFVVTSLSEFGENERFRFETGTTLLTLSLVVVTFAVDRLRGRWRPGGLDRRLDDLGWTAQDATPVAAAATSLEPLRP